MQLSVVIPVHNEAENIAPLVAEIRAALAGKVEFEIIYVDDGSTDNSADEVRKLKPELGDSLRLLQHDHACGQSTAVYSGVHAARADWIATLDGDGQNDPADIPALLAVATSPDRYPGVELVIGHRKNRRDTFIRKLSSRTAFKARVWILRDDTPDTGCGLKVFRRDVFQNLPYFDHMHRFLPALVRRQGGKVVSVPCNHRPRERGQSKYGVWNRLWVGIVDLFGVGWLQRRERRPNQVTEDDFRDA